jgi:hypothetical protein
MRNGQNRRHDASSVHLGDSVGGVVSAFSHCQLSSHGLPVVLVDYVRIFRALLESPVMLLHIWRLVDVET